MKKRKNTMLWTATLFLGIAILSTGCQQADENNITSETEIDSTSSEEVLSYEEREEGCNTDIKKAAFKEDVADQLQPLAERYVDLSNQYSEIYKSKSGNEDLSEDAKRKCENLCKEIESAKRSCRYLAVPNYFYKDQYEAFELCKFTIYMHLERLEDNCRRLLDPHDSNIWVGGNKEEFKMYLNLATTYGVLLKISGFSMDDYYKYIRDTTKMEDSPEGLLNFCVDEVYSRHALKLLDYSDLEKLYNFKSSETPFDVQLRFNQFLKIFKRDDVANPNSLSTSKYGAEYFGIELDYRERGLSSSNFI
ncbi:MAG: hypothetical protein KHX08_03945 [Clostridiales bacterium]|nr:hypothetical protein [Clostridiales bacterium]